MLNYKSILVVAYDLEKSQKALLDVENILKDNSVPYEVHGAHKNNSFDLVLVIGGDGSMLSAAKEFSFLDCPFLGVNLGKVGFMADLDYENLEVGLMEVLSGSNIVEEKETLECNYNGKKYTAYNEIVLHTQKSYKLMQFEVRVDGDFVYRKRADGLIISTSNGSTAYSLSAGGPIISPAVNAFVITSLNPLSLSARPLIVPSDSKIEVKLTKTPPETESYIIIDGNEEIKVEENLKDFVITKSQQSFKLLHPRDHDFFETCRDKLNWSLSKDEK
tara:strand:+ start:709 stop:1533 length:825 start_codon:yes stop_codon:yes gene_type:complete